MDKCKPHEQCLRQGFYGEKIRFASWEQTDVMGKTKQATTPAVLNVMLQLLGGACPLDRNLYNGISKRCSRCCGKMLTLAC